MYTFFIIRRIKVDKDIDYIVFDLGGVLVELTGVPTVLGWMNNRVKEDEMWRMWLLSPAIRNFESGKISKEEFASSIIQEFEFQVDEEKFIEEFILFPKGFYPGAEELLAALKDRFSLACLSNTNELHWNRLCVESEVEKLFQYNFLSHKTGFMKPDKEAFLHVINELKTDPERILFFDDNQMNVDAALSFGIKAVRVKGFSELKRTLQEVGIVMEET